MSAVLLVMAVLDAAQSAGHPPATRPASAPTPFQPGVAIDWNERSVRVAGEVVMISGPLEFFACFPGKEHESVVRLGASGAHVYMALGLIGLAPGKPPRWDEQRGAFAPAEGDLVRVEVEWTDARGRRRVPATSWLRDIEYGQPPLDLPWVFAGSIRLDRGGLACDRTGDAIAVVDFEDNLLSPARDFSNRNQDLWAEAATQAIPPIRTPVTVILSAARPADADVRVDFRGDVWIDGRMSSAAELAELIHVQRRLQPDHRQTVIRDAVLRSVQRSLEKSLAAARVPAEAWSWRDAPPGASSRPAAEGQP